MDTPITAAAAREMTEAATTKTADVGPYLEAVFRRIRQAAREGRSSIIDPWHGLRIIWPTPCVAASVWDALEGLGFKVTHHPLGEPRNPASCPHTEISWELGGEPDDDEPG
jgi:hypothetical protein